MKQRNSLRSLRLPLALVFVLSFVVINCGNPNNLSELGTTTSPLSRDSIRTAPKVCAPSKAKLKAAKKQLARLKAAFVKLVRRINRLTAPPQIPAACYCCKNGGASSCGSCPVKDLVDPFNGRCGQSFAAKSCPAKHSPTWDKEQSRWRCLED